MQVELAGIRVERAEDTGFTALFAGLARQGVDNPQ